VQNPCSIRTLLLCRWHGPWLKSRRSRRDRPTFVTAPLRWWHWW
jgi:hypothetical protein